jgi:hypothetical protein
VLAKFKSALRAASILYALVGLASVAHAQGSRLDNSVFRPGTGIPGVKIAICQPLATTAATVSGNQATYTMATNPITAGFINGMVVQVAGFTGGDTFFNAGTIVNGGIANGQIIVNVTTTQIITTLVHASASAASNGTLLGIGNSTSGCGGLASLFTDAGLGTTTPNPSTADTLGNYGYGVAPGIYYVQIYGIGITTNIKQYIAPCVPAIGCATGVIEGTVLSGQVAYGVGGNNLASDPNFTYDSTKHFVAVNAPENGPTNGFKSGLNVISSVSGSGGLSVFFTNAVGQGGNTGLACIEKGTLPLVNVDLTNGCYFDQDQAGNELGAMGVGYLEQIEAPEPVSIELSGYDIIWADAILHRWRMNNNGGTTTSVAGISDFATPPAIGNTTPAAGSFTTAKATAYTTTTNCAAIGTAANPSIASCSSASAGHFSCATAATGGTCQVNTTAVTANSEIFVFESDTTATGTALGVTCNTSTTDIPTSRILAAYVAATSFTINLGTVTTNPACFSYFIVN